MTTRTHRATNFLHLGVALCISLATGCGDDTTEVSATDTNTPVGCFDADGDGYGDRCDSGTDCNDQDAALFAMLLGFTDTDADGYTVGGVTEVCSGASLPAGFVATSLGADCDDVDAQRFQALVGYPDADLDTYGGESALSVCSGDELPVGMAASGGDCDDNNAAVWESRVAFVDADGDALGDAPILLCAGAALPEGYAELGGDCDDNNATLGADCAVLCVDVDGDGYGLGCDAGPDCDDANPDAYQALVGYTDFDGDGVGEVGGAVLVCAGAMLSDDFADVSGDCDDADEDIYQETVGYVDGDRDGLGGDETELVCTGDTLPVGFTAESGDCSDADGDNTLGCATCRDEDGDGLFFGCDQYESREGPDCAPNDSLRFETRAAYRDRDDDTFTVGDEVVLCVGASLPRGWAEAASAVDDCNDYDETRFRTADLYLDLDGDEVAGDARLGICFGEEAPEGFVHTESPGADCDDLDSARYQLLSGFADWDADDYTVGTAVDVCSGDELPEGYLASASGTEDCEDYDPTVNPSATDVPGDFLDQDCTGGDPLPTNNDGVFVDNAAACGTGTIASPFCDLYDGVDAATTRGVPVYVSAQTYDVNLIDLTVSIYGDWNNTFTARDETEGHDTVLRAEDVTQPVVDAEHPPSAGTLANLTLQGRRADEGIDVLANSGYLTLRSVVITAESSDYTIVLIDNEGDFLWAFDSVFRNANSCSQAFGLYNDAEAVLVRVRFEDIFGGTGTISRNDDNAYGSYAFYPLTMIDSVIEVGSARHVLGIHSQSPLTLINTDVSIVGGQGVCSDSSDIRTARVVLAEDSVDASGGEFFVGFASQEGLAFEKLYNDRVDLRLTDVQIRVGEIIDGDPTVADGIGVLWHPNGGATSVLGSVIEVTSSDWASGVNVSGDLIMSGTDVTLNGGDGDRFGVWNTNGRSVLFDNTIAVGSAIESETRGVIADGALLAVTNRIDVGVAGSAATGIGGDSVSFHIYDTDIVVRGADDEVRGVFVDSSDAELVIEQSTISATSSDGNPVEGVYFEGHRVRVVDNQVSVGEADSVATGLRFADADEVFVMGNTVDFGEMSERARSIRIDDVSRIVVAENTLSTGYAFEWSWAIQIFNSDDSTLVVDNDVLPDGRTSEGEVGGIDIEASERVTVELNTIIVGDTTPTDDLESNVIGVRLGEDVDFVTLVNNVIMAGDGDNSLGLWLAAGAADILHNTIAAGSAQGGESTGLLLENEGSTQLANNIIMPGPGRTSTGIVFANEGDLLVMNNLIYGEGMTLLALADRPVPNTEALNLCFWRGCTLSGGNLSLDPRLADLPGGDTHLTETSPAIDAGLVPSVPMYLDIDGDGRPSAGVDDIGADEFWE